jgi:ATP-dependent helicase/nuclease subunit A
MNYKTPLIEQNGQQDLDAIYEFLNLTQDYYNNISTSLAEFLAWFDQNAIEIKRNLENSLDAVKILTIHGSKGLESPVIIMPDTVSCPSSTYSYFWLSDEIPLWNNSYASNIAGLKQEKKQVDIEEYWRLLYVALTRTQDYLIIGGYTNQKTTNTNSWYELLENVMKKVHTHINDDGSMLYNYGHFTVGNKEDLLNNLAQTELKPLADIDFNYFKMRDFTEFETREQQYGTIAHKILEDIFKTKAISLASSHYAFKNLETSASEKLRKNLAELLASSFIIDWFNNELKTEQEIIIAEDDKLYLGRIDLLVILAHQVFIVDYKTDANPPTDVKLVPEAYKQQLTSYAKAIKVLYPTKKIISYILWLENNNLMEL